MNHYQDLATAAMKRSNYDAALQNYNKAIGRAESASLYDARARCHIKLKDLSSALKDSKKCIQLARTDPIGYTRAGTILVKMNKADAALEVMAHGLKVVKHAGQSFETLRRNHNDLMDRIKPAKSVDPMTVFPRELAVMILDYIDFKQRVKVCSVSKAWNVFIRSVPDLWEHLDLSKARRKVKHAFVVQAIKAGHTKMKRATLNKMFDFEKAVELLIRYCPIEDLTFLEVPALDENMSEVLRRSKHLRSIRLPEDAMPRATLRILRALAKQLQVFVWQSPKLISVADARGLQLDQMRDLNLTCDISAIRVLKDNLANIQRLTLRLASEAVNTWPVLDFSSLKQLRELNLSYAHHDVNAVNLPQGLQCLTLNMKTTLPFWDVANTSMLPSDESAPQLRRMTISLCDFGGAQQEDFAQFCSDPRLRSLHHIGWPRALSWDDMFVPLMVSKWRLLRSIDLSGTSVTGVGVKAAVDGSAPLEELILNDCHELGRDAVEWARSKGINVQSRNKSTELKHERSIRY